MRNLFRKRLFLTALILSVSIHIMFSLAGLILKSHTYKVQKEKTRDQSITFLDINALDRSQSAVNPLVKKQMVESAVADNSETPPVGYEGQRNQTVKKETKAAKIGKLQSSTRPKASSPSKSLAQHQQESKKAEQTTTTPESNRVKNSTRADLENMGLTTTSSGEIAAATSSQKLSASGKKAEVDRQEVAEQTAQKSPGLKSLLPSLSGQSTNFSEAQRDDTLRDVAVSGDTFLNTRESKYFTYYQRIKNRLREKLNPIMYEKVMDSYRRGRHIASTNEAHTAQLMFILNAQGHLEKIYMMSASGMTELDETAMEALKVAAPFPNPPKGMIDEDGRVRIHWAFTYGEDS